MFSEILRELKKPRVYIIFIIGILFCIYATRFTFFVLFDYDFKTISDSLKTYVMENLNVYNIYMFSFTVIYYFFTFLIICPYIYKYHIENSKNYSNFLTIRMGVKKYMLKRAVTGGLLGAITIVSIEVVYFFALWLFYSHAIVHFAFYPDGSYFKDLYFIHPLLYYLIWWVEQFVFAFIFGFFSIVLSMYIKHRPFIYLCPFIIYLVYDFIVSTKLGFDKYSLAYLYNLNICLTSFFAVCLIYSAAAIVLFIIRRKRRMIYGQ